MTQPSLATAAQRPGSPRARPAAAGYQPGACNIGAAEIARRRRAGHVGLLATLVVLGVILVVSAPPIARLLVALPAAGSAVGYLQARLKFCVAFGSRGIFNFGVVGRSDAILDAAERARDRARARQITVASLAIGLAVGFVAVLLPF